MTEDRENEDCSDVSGSASRNCYASLDEELRTRVRFAREAEARQSAMEALWASSRHNPTVRHYLRLWQSGGGGNFESMLCELVAVLASRNETLTKMVIKQEVHKPIPPFTA